MAGLIGPGRITSPPGVQHNLLAMATATSGSEDRYLLPLLVAVAQVGRRCGGRRHLRLLFNRSGRFHSPLWLRWRAALIWAACSGPTTTAAGCSTTRTETHRSTNACCRIPLLPLRPRPASTVV
jgi:hypothetical protein